MNHNRRKRGYQEEKPKIDQSAFVTGLVPPFSEEAEIIVATALIYYPDTIPQIMSVLDKRWFYFEKYGIVFEVCQLLFMDNQPIELISVTEKLKSIGKFDYVGGITFLISLGNNIVNPSNIEYQSKIIQEKFIIRDAIRIGNDIKNMGFDPYIDAFELLDHLQSQTFSIIQSLYKRSSVSFERITLENIDELSRRMAITASVTGIPTGFYQLDELTSGWQKQNLIVIGARPGMGKTALALFFALSASKAKYPVAIFSLEMSHGELVFRIQSMESEVESEKIRSGRLNNYEFNQFKEVALSIKDLPIHIDDSAGISIFELKAKLIRMIHDFGIKLLIVDYLQLMNAGNDFSGNREQEISFISRNLKVIAKECDIPVILLSQLNRAVESRGKGSNIPMLSDLRESGAIEQDADMVIFPHRPEYYKEEMMTDGETPSVDMAELHVAKHRNGKTGAVMTRFDKMYIRFGQYTKYGNSNSQGYKHQPFSPSDKFIEPSSADIAESPF